MKYKVLQYDEIFTRTSGAYQILIGKKLVWLPKSQVVIYKVSKTIEIPEWLYFKKFNPGE